MARPGPDPEHCIRAFELLSEGNSLPVTVELLARSEEDGGIGRRVAIETARRWALIGAKAVSWLREDAKDEDYTGPEFIRQKYAQFLDNLIARGFAELDRGVATYKDVAPIMGRLAKEQTLALGGYAALKVDHSGIGSLGELDPTTRAVVEEYQRRREAQQSLSGNEDS